MKAQCFDQFAPLFDPLGQQGDLVFRKRLVRIGRRHPQ